MGEERRNICVNPIPYHDHPSLDFKRTVTRTTFWPVPTLRSNFFLPSERLITHTAYLLLYLPDHFQAVITHITMGPQSVVVNREYDVTSMTSQQTTQISATTQKDATKIPN